MAITAIVSFNNKSTDHVTVTNFENSSNNLSLPPQSITQCSIWIPWCTSTKDYPHHHITVSGTSPDTTVTPYYIWQDQNEVRYSTDNVYHTNGTYVPGDSAVGGNRQVIVQYGTPSFNQA